MEDDRTLGQPEVDKKHRLLSQFVRNLSEADLLAEHFSPQQRAVLMQVAREGPWPKVKEIAHQVKVSPGNVRTLRGHLQKRLAKLAAAIREQTHAEIPLEVHSKKEGRQARYYLGVSGISFATLQQRLVTACEELAIPGPPGETSTRKAYAVQPHGDMLSRARLSADDIETGRAVKPRHVDRIVEALIQGRNVAVQGAPGCGKSSLAAWSQWQAEKKGLSVDAFSGHDLQDRDEEQICSRLGETPPECVLLIDDIHLIRSAMGRLNSFPWSVERRFFLVGRAPMVETVMRKGEVPEIQEDLIEITVEDSTAVAEALARQYLDQEETEQLLRSSAGALVFTKWLLEAVQNHGVRPDVPPVEAAARMLQTLRDEEGNEVLRMFLTLAAFGWMELWCPESFLADVLGFQVETLERLRAPLHETERQEDHNEGGNYAVRLWRHPKMCGLFLDAAPKLGLVCRQRVVGPTATALGLGTDTGKRHDLAPLVIGAALTHRVVDLLSVERRLVYGGRASDYVSIVKMAADLSIVRSQRPPGQVLPLEEKVERLKFAFAAANGERRLRGGEAGRSLLTEFQQRLGVSEIPTEPFAEKGYLLYQDAYLRRLINAEQSALDRFEESAKTDESWDATHDSPLHRGKAMMSRIAASLYRIDLALFAGSKAPALEPDRAELRRVQRALQDMAPRLDALLASSNDDWSRRMFALFSQECTVRSGRGSRVVRRGTNRS